MFDTIVIGGGPAGMTAALYTSRREMKTTLISRDIGGQMINTSEIENYPGFDRISGIELGQKMLAGAQKFGAEIRFNAVNKITKIENGFEVETDAETLKTRSIVLAFGKSPRELNIPGEKEFKGKGVSYCATCDSAFYRGKTVAIAGGGNSAVEAAILTAKFATKVYIVNINESLAAEAVRISILKSLPNIEIINSDPIVEIVGSAKVEKIKLKSGKELDTDGVIVEIGYIVDHSLIKDLVKCDNINQIIVNEFQETSHAGIFAAGDLTQTKYKQIVIAAGEGAKAALSCYNYLQGLEGKSGVIGDWKKK